MQPRSFQASNPGTEAQGPTTHRILKDSRGPRGNIKGPERPPRTCPLCLYRRRGRAEVSEWYQHPVRVSARADPPASRSLKAILSLGLPVLSHETQQGTHTLDLEALPLPTTRDHPGPQRIRHCVHPPPTCTHTCTRSVYTHTMHTHLYTHGTHHTVYMPMCTRNMNTQKAYIKFAHTQHAYMYTQRCTQNRHTHYFMHSVVTHMYIQCAHAT